MTIIVLVPDAGPHEQQTVIEEVFAVGQIVDVKIISFVATNQYRATMRLEEPALHRYWFEFEPSAELPPGVRMGCGATGFGIDDALDLLTKLVFSRTDLPITRIIQGRRRLDTGSRPRATEHGRPYPQRRLVSAGLRTPALTFGDFGRLFGVALAAVFRQRDQRRAVLLDHIFVDVDLTDVATRHLVHDVHQR